MGVGRTLNISSSGVLFTSDYELPIDTRVEVSIRWPVELDENCGLNLVGNGPVVRHMNGQLALRLRKWEFRTTAQNFTGNQSDGCDRYSSDAVPDRRDSSNATKGSPLTDAARFNRAAMQIL